MSLSAKNVVEENQILKKENGELKKRLITVTEEKMKLNIRIQKFQDHIDNFVSKVRFV